MIYMLTVILVLVGAAASAIVIICHVGCGRAGLAPMATATTGKLAAAPVG